MSINYKLKYTLVFICFFICSLNTLSAHPYKTDYPDECENGLLFYQEHKQLFQQAAEQTGFPPAFLFAIVAPEITQYAFLRDKLETYSLKFFYVQGGADYSNFSIGYFQMKPAFIEQLEDSLLQCPSLKTKHGECLMEHTKDRTLRVERIKRLEQTEWQVKYLALFCDLVRNRFPQSAHLPEKEQLAFYATAYNAGFHHSMEQIKEKERNAMFPRFSNKKYRYSEISQWFYECIISGGKS